LRRRLAIVGIDGFDVLDVGGCCAGHVVQPVCPAKEHVAVREELDDVAVESPTVEGISSAEHSLAISTRACNDFKKGKLALLVHLAIALPNGILLIEEESLDGRVGDGHAGRGDADGTAFADELDLPRLFDRRVFGGGLEAGACIGPDARDGDGTREECT